MSNEQQQHQRSRVRQVAEERESGFSTTTLKLPEGMKFFKPELGMNTVDIVGYKTGTGNPKCQDAGVLWYERTYWKYRGIGPKQQDFVASGKTFGEADPIQEWRQKAARDGSQDKKLLDSLEPKERQLFLIRDHKHPELGIQLWEMSYHNFGKKLLDSIQTSPESWGWDYFYFPDLRGFTLGLTITNKSMGTGNPFKEVSNITFLPRQTPLPPEIANHTYCLDDMLIRTDYKVLWRAFHNLPADGSQDAAVSVDGTYTGPGPGVGVGQTGQTSQQPPTTGSGQTAGSATTPPQTQQQVQTTAQTDPLGESIEVQKARVVQLGALHYANGGKRDGNPFDKGNQRHTWWLEGWMDEMDRNPRPATTPPQTQQQAPTAQSLGIERMSEVSYNGALHTVWRISDDGCSLTLMTAKDDMVPNVPVGAVVRATGAQTTPPVQTTAAVATPPAAAQQTQSTPKPAAAPAADDWDSEWKNP